MIGKEKCKMLKQIRMEIAKENDIQMVIEECTHQGRCKGTCPRCEAEVAYLEAQLEKRRNLGKAVCVAGISAAMFTSTLQASSVQAYGKTVSETTYSQGITPTSGGASTPDLMPEGTMAPASERPTEIPMPEGTMAPASQRPTEIPMPEGTMAPASERPTEIPMPEGTMAPVSEGPTETATPSAIVSGTSTPTITPTESVGVTPSVKPKVTRIAFISKIENNCIYIKDGNDNLATLANDFYLQLMENAQITKIVDGVEQVITIEQLQPNDKIEFVFSGLLVPTDPDGFLEGCEKVKVLESSNLKVTPTPVVLPEGDMVPKDTATPPAYSSNPTETPLVTAVPTPTDEYLVYTQSPISQNSGNTANPETATSVPEKKKCVVTYLNEDEKTIYDIQEMEQGEILQNMPTPVREGYLFDGWYLMGEEQVKVSANTTVSGNMSIVAHWKKVTVKETNIRKVKSMVNGTLYIKWGKVQKAEGYRIVLASNAKMTKGKKYVTVGSKKTSVKLKGLREGKKYYVAVYAYRKDSEKNKIYGTCKKNKSVTITVK